MKFYYGWAVVAVGFLAYFAGSIPSQGFGLLIKPMSEDLGWSRSSIVAGNTVATIAAALSAPLIGYLLDRWGARAVMVVSAVLGGVGLIATAWVTAPWQFYLVFGAAGGIARNGTNGLAAPTAVANWFVRRRGRAMAVTIAGLSFGSFFLQPLTQWLIETADWRTAFTVLGVIFITVLAVPAAVFMRRRPEDLGLRPDGDPPAPLHHASAGSAAAMRPPEPDWDTRDALRTSTFWLLAVIWFLCGLGGSGMTIIMASSFADKGIEGADLAIVVASFSLVSFCVKFVWGAVSERFRLRQYMMAYLLLSVAVFAWHNYAAGFWGCLASSMLLAVSMGGSLQLQAQVWPDLFGRRSAGAIRGLSMPFQSASSALGPIAGAFFFDATGSYAWAVWMYVAAYVLGAVLITQVRPLRAPTPRAVAAGA